MLDFNEAPSHDVTIQGMIFPVRQIFEEGHELTAIEAGVLNQTRDENLRNNYAAKIKAVMKEEGVEDVKDLSDEAKKMLTDKFPAFEEGYEFGSRGGAREVDPVRKQAILFATESVKNALQKKGYKLSEVGADKIRELATNAVDEHPKFLEKAKIAVAARDEAKKDLEIEIG
ncbi:MAG: hypothetical protein ACWGQW_02695 [bacterium]